MNDWMLIAITFGCGFFSGRVYHTIKLALYYRKLAWDDAAWDAEMSELKRAAKGV